MSRYSRYRNRGSASSYGYDGYGYGDSSDAYTYGITGGGQGDGYYPSNSRLQNAYADYYSDPSSDPYTAYPAEETRNPDPYMNDYEEDFSRNTSSHYSEVRGVSPRLHHTHPYQEDERIPSNASAPRSRSLQRRTPEYANASTSPYTDAKFYSTSSRPYTPPGLFRTSNTTLEPTPFHKRSPSPPVPAPPPPPPPPRVPDESYLTTSLAPSFLLSNPTSTRKLLVLDLNGTLLIRPARTVATPYNPNSAKHKYLGKNGIPTGAGTGSMRFRPVHPRPYMPSFRSYLFDERTRKWLDTMVWSSAQPHSVDDMVGKCFDGDVTAGGGVLGQGEEELRDRKKGRENLVAIWARDTLGLTQGEYNSKTQTTKDLSKPWAQLPLVPSSSQLHFDTNDPEAQPESEAKTAQAQPHSAQTTLLLDDSPLKAHLQPYNHVCIREYVAHLRGKDLEVFARHREKALLNAEGVANGAVKGKKRKRKEKKRAEKAKKKAKAMGMTGPTDGVDKVERVDSESGTSVSCDSPSPSLALSLAPQAQPAVEEQGAEAIIETEPVVGEGYDETLLAVIGVLDEIRQQSNVAGWIRAGGLWGPVDLKPIQAHPLVSSSAHSAEVNSTGNDADAPFPLPQDQNSSETPPDADKAMWFDHEPTFTYWVRRGREALHELGIEVTHGIVG